MRKNNKFDLLQGLALGLTFFGLTSTSQGALTITINQLNTTTVDLNITGTLESSATGDDKRFFALVAGNHAGNGSHTEWMALHRLEQITSDSASVNGVHFGDRFRNVFVSHGSGSFGDSFYFRAPSDLVAGDQIDWDIKVSGEINPDAPGGLKIMLGSNNATNDWSVVEPDTIVKLAVPEPSAFALLTLSALVFSSHRRRITAS